MSGTVKFKGVPVNNATIQFLPTPESKATSQSAATIHDGKYVLPAIHGLMPGKYQVRIIPRNPPRNKKGGSQPAGPKPKSKGRQIIPQRFNAQTTLECEVTLDGPNNFDFDLK